MRSNREWSRHSVHVMPDSASWLVLVGEKGVQEFASRREALDAARRLAVANRSDLTIYNRAGRIDEWEPLEGLLAVRGGVALQPER